MLGSDFLLPLDNAGFSLRLCPHCGAFIAAEGDEPEQERNAS